MVISEGSKKRRSYTSEFKIEAARLVEEQGYSVVTASNLLGISRSNLWRWCKQYCGQRLETRLCKSEKEELVRLRVEVKKLRMEHSVLKKAAVLFAKDSV